MTRETDGLVCDSAGVLEMKTVFEPVPLPPALKTASLGALGPKPIRCKGPAACASHG